MWLFALFRSRGWNDTYFVGGGGCLGRKVIAPMTVFNILFDLLFENAQKQTKVFELRNSWVQLKEEMDRVFSFWQRVCAWKWKCKKIILHFTVEVWPCALISEIKITAAVWAQPVDSVVIRITDVWGLLHYIKLHRKTYIDRPLVPFSKAIWEAFRDCNLDFSSSSLKCWCWEAISNGWPRQNINPE